jgi:hypothetical protein
LPPRKLLGSTLIEVTAATRERSGGPDVVVVFDVLVYDHRRVISEACGASSHNGRRTRTTVAVHN